MVDIMDMEDIFYEILVKYPLSITQTRFVIKKLIEEVKDFVDNQKNIACANCKGYKFKNLKERWQVG